MTSDILVFDRGTTNFFLVTIACLLLFFVFLTEVIKNFVDFLYFPDTSLSFSTNTLIQGLAVSCMDY